MIVECPHCDEALDQQDLDELQRTLDARNARRRAAAVNALPRPVRQPEAGTYAWPERSATTIDPITRQKAL